MSEKRFIISKNTSERSTTGIIDIERQTHLWVSEVVDLLNELYEENEQLRKELDNFKPVMFQDVRKGTVILYSKKKQ